ncbi:hypothetical protein NQ176_g3135 [Zarea fungicola]|uniref:Uncharacterized protein n=1 Tax=Zarea fungicola TaxID=93591 RepID=A0ACC1NM09_9HYPO|nr:hypothetical protein NQ176_g3135 [Lecanicillium fungicola]
MALSTGDASSVTGTVFTILGVIVALFVFLWTVPIARAATWGWLSSVIKCMICRTALPHRTEGDLELGLPQQRQFPSPRPMVAPRYGSNPPPWAIWRREMREQTIVMLQPSLNAELGRSPYERSFGFFDL